MSQDEELKAFNKPLVAEYRANGGRVSGWEGNPLLLLTTIGARSGQPHVTPLSYCLDSERIFVLAANVGAAKHPAWYHNLLAHPEVTVELGGESWPARAVVVTSEAERERLFGLRVSTAPIVQEYQQQTTRQFPVVILVRAGDEVTQHQLLSFEE